MQRLEDSSTTIQVTFAVIGYSLCSSTMLLANKMALVYLPAPSTVSLLQILFATVSVIVIRQLGFRVDWFEWEKTKPYLTYVAIFVAAIYSNMQALKSSNVETVIVFRALSPIAVCFFDVWYLGREYPSLRSATSLICVALGAMIYCYTDSQLTLSGISAYYWVFIYFVLITVEMTYGKVLTSNVKMDSVWGPVLYCNAFSIGPMFMLSLYGGEINSGSMGMVEKVSASGWIIITFSCVVGTLIGYTGWLCRGMVSATSFTLIGVVNKFLTVLLNVVLWDKHSSPLGIAAVCFCLLTGAFYQQAPKREESRRPEICIQLAHTSKPGDEDSSPLLAGDRK